MRWRRLVPVTLLALAAVMHASAVAQPADCPLDGAPMLWRLSWCMALSATDDELHPDVQKCMDREAVDEGAACAARLRYKTALCALSVEAGWWPDTLAACVAAEETTPRIVRDGGV